jgi:hypothetical protein
MLSRKKTVWPLIFPLNSEFRITCYSFLSGRNLLSQLLIEHIIQILRNVWKPEHGPANGGKIWENVDKVKLGFSLEVNIQYVAAQTAQFHRNAKESNWETPPQNNVGQPWIVKCQWMRLLLHHSRLQSNTVHTIQLHNTSHSTFFRFTDTAALETTPLLSLLQDPHSKLRSIPVDPLLAMKNGVGNRCGCCYPAYVSITLRSHIWPNSGGGGGEGLEWRAFWTNMHPL